MLFGCCFLLVYLFYRGVKLVYFYNFSGVGGGVQHFPGESNFFSRGGGGFQLLITKETYRTCDFLSGWVGSGPHPPSGSAHEDELTLKAP